jgi:hypothetical protein
MARFRKDKTLAQWAGDQKPAALAVKLVTMAPMMVHHAAGNSPEQPRWVTSITFALCLERHLRSRSVPQSKNKRRKRCAALFLPVIVGWI